MQRLLTSLEDFYIKERGHLVREVLGRSDFRPSQSFLNKLSRLLGLQSIEGPVFGGLDYHLDWLHDSLCQQSDSAALANNRRTQQDVDYLVAFTVNSVTHVVLIEAKFTSSWSNKQMCEKVERLTSIFGACGHRWHGVIPHIILMSPSRPRRIPYANWPDWMKPDTIAPLWIELPLHRTAAMKSL